MKLNRDCLFRRVGLVLAGIFLLTVGVKAASSQAEGKIPRAEHPKPQFCRDAWLNLNGQWDFAMDPDVVGIKESWQDEPSRFNIYGFSKSIISPSDVALDFKPAELIADTFAYNKSLCDNVNPVTVLLVSVVVYVSRIVPSSKYNINSK